MNDERYWRENDAKFRAVAQNATYEQFEDIVKASHLKPLDKKDKSPNAKSRSSIWNSISLAGKKSGSENAAATHAQKSGNTGLHPTSVGKQAGIKNIDEFYSLWRCLEIEERIDLVSEVGEDNIARIFSMETPPELLGDMLHTFLAFRSTTNDISTVVKTLGK